MSSEKNNENRNAFLETEHIRQNTLNYKYCTFCGKPIPRSADFVCCPDCQELILFSSVRDYIRANDVNEFQVAEHFDIPLRLVRHWIKEGRIEYKTATDGKYINSIRCSRCGAPATFGSLCAACLKLLNKNVHGYGMQVIPDDDKMRYLDIADDKS
jgi:hypothetical protein